MIEPLSIPAASASFVARFGHAMRKRQRAISIVQWAIVAIYAFFLFVPLFFSPATQQEPILDNIYLFVQFLFWGIAWPLIMLSMMLFGRAWCGIFCPDGTLTEFASRHGQRRSIPRWMRWPGWPCTMLVITTLYGQLVGIYDFHFATLLLLGLPTLAAIGCGFFYGNGKRVWCMYLCPANGVFALLSKVSPIHFRVQEEKWQQHCSPLPKIDCPVLIDIRRMKSASACHACGRCSGHLDAVELASRRPDAEIIAAKSKSEHTTEAVTLIFGVLGGVSAAMHWSASKWFPVLKSVLSNFGFVVLDHYVAPWWLLVNYPDAHRVFTLLDGLSILTYILGGGLLLGITIFSSLWLATKLAGSLEISWQRLSLALIPIAGIVIILGLSSITVNLLRRDGLMLPWVPYMQATLLFLAIAFSLWMGTKLILRNAVHHRSALRLSLAILFYMLPPALICIIWLGRYLA